MDVEADLHKTITELIADDFALQYRIAFKHDFPLKDEFQPEVDVSVTRGLSLIRDRTHNITGDFIYKLLAGEDEPMGL